MCKMGAMMGCTHRWVCTGIETLTSRARPSAIPGESSVKCRWLVLLAALELQGAASNKLQAEVVLSGPFRKRSRFSSSTGLCLDRDLSRQEKFLDYLS